MLACFQFQFIRTFIWYTGNRVGRIPIRQQSEGTQLSNAEAPQTSVRAKTNSGSMETHCVWVESLAGIPSTTPKQFGLYSRQRGSGWTQTLRSLCMISARNKDASHIWSQPLNRLRWCRIRPRDTTRARCISARIRNGITLYRLPQQLLH